MQQESVVKGGNVCASSCCVLQVIAAYASVVKLRFGMLTGSHTKGASIALTFSFLFWRCSIRNTNYSD